MFLLQFKEFMTRLEGLERTEIPQIVIHRLIEEFGKRVINPVQNPEEVTYWRVRQYLQELGYSHFFENIMKIISILTKVPPLTFSVEQREILISRFLLIQQAFEKHKGQRKNFLSYSYVMFKFCEMLGYDEFLPFLPLLKAPQNQIAADRIWREICKECDYTFIPTDPAKGAFYSDVAK